MTEYRTVKITDERGCIEFKGTDLETYGPYDQGEIIEVPKDNADILVNRDVAEEVNLND